MRAEAPRVRHSHYGGRTLASKDAVRGASESVRFRCVRVPRLLAVVVVESYGGDRTAGLTSRRREEGKRPFVNDLCATRGSMNCLKTAVYTHDVWMRSIAVLPSRPKVDSCYTTVLKRRAGSRARPRRSPGRGVVI